MARMSLRLLLLIGPILLVVLAISKWQDPAHLFDREATATRIANILLGNENASGAINYDERLVQRYYARGLAQPKSILVLGSSRVMQVREDMFPGHSLFNAAVSGASIEDIAAIYEVFRERNLIPERVIVGLDPWLLNRNNAQVRWKAIATDYARFARRASQPVPVCSPCLEMTPYVEVIRPQYFQEALRQVVRGFATGRHERASVGSTKENDIDSGLKLRDGSILYPRDVREQSSEAVARSAQLFAHGPVYSLEGFSEIDTRAAAVLEAFLAALRSDGVKVTILLSPFHPVSYSTLLSSGNYGMLPESERVFRRIARRLGIVVIGSFDPGVVGGTGLDFFDGMHPRPSLFERMFAEVQASGD